MSKKEKIKLYEENIIKNKIQGYKKTEINKNNVRRKINHWNNINNDGEEKKIIEKKVIMEKNINEEKKVITKEKVNEDEYEFENCVINM